jgi:hypothetical protein
MGQLITIKANAGSLQANTEYKFTFPVTFTDTYGAALPQEVTYTFTTGS